MHERAFEYFGGVFLSKQDAIQKVKLADLDLQDVFFDSLRQDYGHFDEWFNSKLNHPAFVFREHGKIEAFMLLKNETESDDLIKPKFELARRLKISTLKINSHGTVLGQRFLNIALQVMFNYNFNSTYVTLFDKQTGLIKLLENFGFKKWGTRSNGELVYVKSFENVNNIYKDFPRFSIGTHNNYLLGIFPKFHTDMFPDSKLTTERKHIVDDLAFTNTVEKIYICNLRDVEQLKAGDLLTIYRTGEGNSAEYSAVATSICTVVEFKYITDFDSVSDFINYCGKGSVFSKEELTEYYRTKRFPKIIKMLYNCPLNKRITRHDLIEQIGINRYAYPGFMKLTNDQFRAIVKEGGINESFIIN
jgi:hypothetical protein